MEDPVIKIQNRLKCLQEQLQAMSATLRNGQRIDNAFRQFHDETYATHLKLLELASQAG